MFGQRNIAAVVAEFLGAGILTLLVLSVQRSTIGVPFFVALAAGLTVAMASFVFGATSGGHFNPALSLALWTARKLSTIRTILYIGAQLLGGWAAYGLYTYFVGQTLQPIKVDNSVKLVAAEAIGALIFTLGWASLMYQRFTPAVRAAVSGLSLTVGIVAVSSASLGLLNPAVALGVRAWSIVYVAGPIIGAIIGVNLFKYLFAAKGVEEVAEAISSVSSATAPIAETNSAAISKADVGANNAVVAAKRKTRSAATTKTAKTKVVAKKTTTRKNKK